MTTDKITCGTRGSCRRDPTALTGDGLRAFRGGVDPDWYGVRRGIVCNVHFAGYRRSYSGKFDLRDGRPVGYALDSPEAAVVIASLEARNAEVAQRRESERSAHQASEAVRIAAIATREWAALASEPVYAVVPETEERYGGPYPTWKVLPKSDPDQSTWGRLQLELYRPGAAPAQVDTHFSSRMTAAQARAVADALRLAADAVDADNAERRPR